MEQASAALSLTPESLLSPTAGITDTLCRAELAAIAAAMMRCYAQIAPDSLASFLQIRKQLLP
eukprot:1158467-Pelagomonas_calceolata.AAC.1